MASSIWFSNQITDFQPKCVGYFLQSAQANIHLAAFDSADGSSRQASSYCKFTLKQILLFPCLSNFLAALGARLIHMQFSETKKRR